MYMYIYLKRLEVEENKYKALKRQKFIDMLNHETTDAPRSFRAVLIRGVTLEHCSTTQETRYKNYRDETSDATDTTFYVHTTFTPNGLEHNA